MEPKVTPMIGKNGNVVAYGVSSEKYKMYVDLCPRCYERDAKGKSEDEIFSEPPCQDKWHCDGCDEAIEE